MSDLYLERLLKDLKFAESELRHEIRTADNPYNRNPEENRQLKQANVDRLHKLIREHLAKPNSTKADGGGKKNGKET